MKRLVFFELLDLAGRVYIVVRYSDRVSLGKRSFTDEEQQKGLTLVFTSRMAIQWDGEGITATLVFGAQPHKCFIPADDVIAVYSPDLQTQFTSTPRQMSAEQPADERKHTMEPASIKGGPRRAAIRSENAERGRLIEVDFAARLAKNSGKEDGA